MRRRSLFVNAALLLSLLVVAPARVAQATDVKKPEQKQEEPKKKDPPKKPDDQKDPPRSEPKDPPKHKSCHSVQTGTRRECFDGDGKNCMDVPVYKTVCD
jgi:hypothetical protein